MVLVLLGILSAVAVPKYFDLQEQAQQNAAKATVAEFQARLNARFASALLQGLSCKNAVTAAVSGKGSEATALDVKGMDKALKEDDFGGWTIKSYTEATDKKSAELVVTYNDKDYPNTATATSEKKFFKVQLPLCQ